MTGLRYSYVAQYKSYPNHLVFLSTRRVVALWIMSLLAAEERKNRCSHHWYCSPSNSCDLGDQWVLDRSESEREV